MIHSLIRNLLRVLFHFGAIGLLVLGVLDSSFFFLPFGNDFLLVLLVARNHERLPIYLLTAAAGSTIGVLLLDSVIRARAVSRWAISLDSRILEPRSLRHSCDILMRSETKPLFGNPVNLLP